MIWISFPSLIFFLCICFSEKSFQNTALIAQLIGSIFCIYGEFTQVPDGQAALNYLFLPIFQLIIWLIILFIEAVIRFIFRLIFRL